MDVVAEAVMLSLFGSAAWFLGGLLFDRRKRVHHFICRLHRSPYPPHPEDWVISNRIRTLQFFIILLLCFSSVGVIGSLAGLALAILR
ncbi:MAG TPA: hypothetical protein VFK81_10890 [Terriglobales bacterium]|jgi:hypothetical protein|nr:hypothetical protein [Terriglobales bacterium]